MRHPLRIAAFAALLSIHCGSDSGGHGPSDGGATGGKSNRDGSVAGDGGSRGGSGGSSGSSGGSSDSSGGVVSNGGAAKGGAAGSGGGNGGSGGGAGGTQNRGGAGGAGASVDCTNTAGAPQGGSPNVMRTVHGSNGDFTDVCDATGNLTYYYCELTGSCRPQQPCNQTPTGKVVSETMDCAGTCVAGVCTARCPIPGESLVYKTISGSTATFESARTRRQYVCQLSSVVVSASYDCLMTPRAGLQVVVTEAGDAGEFCSGNSTSLVVGSTAVDPHCAYDCQVPP